jgi:putative ABC transport system permease protein
MAWFRKLSRSVEMVKGTMSVSMRMIFDIFAQIFRTLWAHKLRSFLTMFGVAWGVGSLLLLVGLGEGFRSGNKRGLAEYGEDIMFIFPGRAPVVAGSMNSIIFFQEGRLAGTQ